MDQEHYFAKTIQVPYKSGWYIVVLPTLITLGVWAGLAVGVPALLSWNIPEWLGMLLCFGGFIPGLAIAVVTYRFLLRLAEQGRGELTLEGDRLRWRTGRRWHEMDFTQPYSAKVAAGFSGLGKSNADITFYHSSVPTIHLRGARREDILHFFPEPYFVDELAAMPEEGLPGFEFAAPDPAAASFFAELLGCLWRNRQQNERFRLYQKFPWHRRPQPAFRHIRMIDLKACTLEDQTFIEELKAQVVSSLFYVEATPDYLIGWVYHLLRSKLDGLPDICCVMPLGYITAEVSFPRPDWKPFIVGNVLKQALAATLGTKAPAGGPYLEDRYYLYVRGRGEDGARLELTFDWYGPGDEGYEEAEFLVRFVQAMQQAQFGPTDSK
ncbi:hypothetical protein [Anaerolinea sp.]|uniref:hypothetical protein n=1 Tax=Anaerolinea sp. TaxID=1872519 RepID=UPI002ACE2AE3|nr:hypothetical protein [Anaerolinea sp.]